jgi:hypothetical protein
MVIFTRLRHQLQGMLGNEVLSWMAMCVHAGHLWGKCSEELPWVWLRPQLVSTTPSQSPFPWNQPKTPAPWTCSNVILGSNVAFSVRHPAQNGCSVNNAITEPWRLLLLRKHWLLTWTFDCPKGSWKRGKAWHPCLHFVSVSFALSRFLLQSFCSHFGFQEADQ